MEHGAWGKDMRMNLIRSVNAMPQAPCHMPDRYIKLKRESFINNN